MSGDGLEGPLLPPSPATRSVGGVSCHGSLPSLNDKSAGIPGVASVRKLRLPLGDPRSGSAKSIVKGVYVARVHDGDIDRLPRPDDNEGS